jgi:hypothetical protein
MTRSAKTFGELYYYMKAGRLPNEKLPKVETWSVYYFGKVLFKGQYSHCVKFKNQFKGQADYKHYQIKP